MTGLIAPEETTMTRSAVAAYNAAAAITPLPAAEPVSAVALTRDDLEVLRATVLPKATDAQLRLFGEACRRRGLDPFAKEIYAWPDGKGGIEIVTGIDGLRRLAQRSGEYRGQTHQQWCGPDGEWTDVWLQKDPPAAARITVHRQGYEPFTGVALWREYAKPNAVNWAKYSTVMLSKCAEANALRHLFPQETSGIYIAEELGEHPQWEPQQRQQQQQAGAAEVVDRQTGEIVTMTNAELTAAIKTLREALGWTVNDVQAEAAKLGHDLKKRTGLLAMKAHLEKMVAATEPDAAPADDEGLGDEGDDSAIETEYRMAGFDGMPTGDRYAEIAPEDH